MITSAPVLHSRYLRGAALAAFVFLLATVNAEQGGQPLAVGILPFDVASVEGSAETASEALAKLVRIEMIKNRQLRPILVKLPEGTETPIPPETAAEVTRAAEATVALVGTVIEAETDESSHRVSSGSIGGIGIGGSISRTSASVSLHVELVDAASGKIVDTFEVQSRSSGTGVGADFSSSLGGFDLGDAGWEKTPMGKALREAAQKVTTEIVRRKAKLATRPPA